MEQLTPPATATRTGTIEWEDPLASFEQGMKLSGMDYMRAMMAGELPPPPIAMLLGMLPVDGRADTTIELKTNFVRAITRDTGRILCEADVVHRGGTIATAEGRLYAESTGKLLAHGLSTCLIVHANGNGRQS